MIGRIVLRVVLLAIFLLFLAVQHVCKRFECVFRVSQTVVTAVDRVDHDSSGLVGDQNVTIRGALFAISPSSRFQDVNNADTQIRLGKQRKQTETVRD